MLQHTLAEPPGSELPAPVAVLQRMLLQQEVWQRVAAQLAAELLDWRQDSGMPPPSKLSATAQQGGLRTIRMLSDVLADEQADWEGESASPTGVLDGCTCRCAAVARQKHDAWPPLCLAGDLAISCHLAIALQCLVHTCFLDSRRQYSANTAGLAGPSSLRLLAAAIGSACRALRLWQQRQQDIWWGHAAHAEQITVDVTDWPCEVATDIRRPAGDWMLHPVARTLHALTAQMPNGGGGGGGGSRGSGSGIRGAGADSGSLLLFAAGLQSGEQPGTAAAEEGPGQQLADQQQQTPPQQQAEEHEQEAAAGAATALQVPPAQGAAVNLLVECLALSLAKLVCCDNDATSSSAKTVGAHVDVSIMNVTPHSVAAVPLLVSTAASPLCR
jgi:hypothetical protein